MGPAQEGLGLMLTELSGASSGIPPVRVDVRPGREIDREMQERSQPLREQFHAPKPEPAGGVVGYRTLRQAPARQATRRPRNSR
jgi:hypothetical protein